MKTNHLIEHSFTDCSALYRIPSELLKLKITTLSPITPFSYKHPPFIINFFHYHNFRKYIMIEKLWKFHSYDNPFGKAVCPILNWLNKSSSKILLPFGDISKNYLVINLKSVIFTLISCWHISTDSWVTITIK